MLNVPVWVQAAHALVEVLPDAFEKTTGEKYIITMHALAYILVPAAKLAPTMRRGGVHSSIKASRSAQFIHDLVGASLDTSPIRYTNGHTRHHGVSMGRSPVMSLLNISHKRASMFRAYLVVHRSCMVHPAK